MTPEVSAALHAEAHAMERALSALNRAIAACKSHQRTAAPVGTANAACAQHGGTGAPADAGAGKPSSVAMHASIDQSTADGAMRAHVSRDQLANIAHAQRPRECEQSSALLTSDGKRKAAPTAQAALPDVPVPAAETAGTARRGAVGDSGGLTGPQQRDVRSTSMHVDATSCRSDPAVLTECSLPQHALQSESLAGSLHAIGSTDAGFQLGQQHLGIQDVEELLQPSGSMRAEELPSGPANGESGGCAPRESPPRAPHAPQSQHTPPHGFNSAGRAFRPPGVPGGDLPGCIPDTPSGSEGPAGQPQPHPSPVTMMQKVRAVVPGSDTQL